MAMANISPLHSVVDADRWSAERPLGRLVILAHAAFLEAGFLAAGADRDNPFWLPTQVGTTASALPLRYTAPQLLHRPDAATVAVRLCAHGGNLIFYVRVKFGKPWLDTYWICLDAVAAARLLSCGLDDTARALTRDARVAALWSALTYRLCRRVLVDLCAKNGVALEPDPNFMSLPGDLKAAILVRLTGGEDLARVECTCTGLQRLFAERDAALWKPRYEHLVVQRQIAGVGTDEATPEKSWKERYMAAYQLTLPPKLTWTARYGDVVAGRRPIVVQFESMSGTPCSVLALWPEDLCLLDRWNDRPFIDFVDSWRLKDPIFVLVPPFDLPEKTIPRRRKRRAIPRYGCSHDRALVLVGGHKKQWRGAGAVHSPSSRHRWNHR